MQTNTPKPVNRYQVAAINRLTGDDLQTMPVRSREDAERLFERALAMSSANPMIAAEIRTLH